jgi:hypothetical protein
MSGWADRIHMGLVETADAFNALHEARKQGSSTAKLDRLSQEAANRSNALKAECRDAFARSRGWTFNKKENALLDPFAYASNGARFIDHAEFFDSLDQKRVALVTHSYAPAQDLADYAERHGWTAELLPFSWWNPKVRGGTRAVLFTLKMGAKWAK